MPGKEAPGMKWVRLYLLGYAILIAGVLAALWKTGVLQRIGAGWTGIALLIALGFGVMIAVSGSGTKESIEVDHT
jgi:hypothetical protein